MANKEPFFHKGTNGKGVLLCHTLAGEPSQMKELGKKLNKKGYTVSCPLYAGHGGSFNDVIQTDVTDWYDTVVEAYKELSSEVDDVYAVGMSIGGTFAVKLAQEYDLKGVVSINGPVIGFDLPNDVFNFAKNTDDQALIKRYTVHRHHYFRFVTELGQIENLKRITCPLFVLQGSQDLARYKTSAMLLMDYASSETKQRRDYANSMHMILQDNDKKQAIKDIIAFLDDN